MLCNNVLVQKLQIHHRSFFQNKWDAAIAFVLGESVDDDLHIDALANSINSGARKLFSVITKKELFELVFFYFRNLLV